MNYKKTQTKLETWWICEQNQKFDKEIATIKNFKLKKKTEILEFKKEITELKNPNKDSVDCSIVSFKSRLKHAEERISNLEFKILKITQSEKQKVNRMKKSDGSPGTMGHNDKKQKYSHYGNSRRIRERMGQKIYLKQ